MYKPHPLLRPNMLQLLVRPQEVIRIRLRDDLSRIWLLNEVLVALLLCESDSILLRLEIDVCSLHEVCR